MPSFGSIPTHGLTRPLFHQSRLIALNCCKRAYLTPGVRIQAFTFQPTPELASPCIFSQAAPVGYGAWLAFTQSTTSLGWKH
jgi:hypothetical protein